MKRERSIHMTAGDGKTKCGELIEGLETSVSSGTREIYLEVTSDPDKVNCRRCLRCLGGMAIR